MRLVHQIILQATRTHVLVIEDDESSAMALGAYLELKGFEVRTCARDGVRKACRVLPQVIVCDLQMPEMDGIDVARTRPLPALGMTRFIAVSGHGDEAARARARSAGYDVYVVKPFGPREIEIAIAGRRAGGTCSPRGLWRRRRETCPFSGPGSAE